MKTIIFDFGNVIGFFDHHVTLGRLAKFTDMSAADMYRSIYEGELEEAFEKGDMTLGHFLCEVKKVCRIDCEEEAMRVAFADIFRPNPEVCSLIPELKKHHRLLLGSNTNELHSTHFQQQFAEVLGHFDDLVMSHRIRVRKPRPEFFAECQRLAGCPASECLFIDDMPANVAGAKAFGLEALLYRPDNDLRGQLASFGVRV